jgi:hypothetical protein
MQEGAFVSMRHDNQVWGLEANLMFEICKDVQWEPKLIPLSDETVDLRLANTAAEARWDISSREI